MWDFPLSWAVVVLSVYGLYLIRKQRQRRALSAVRGEYRQVAARDADRAFDDAAFLSSDGDDDDLEEIQMRNFPSGGGNTDDDDGLSLEETNG